MTGSSANLLDLIRHQFDDRAIERLGVAAGLAPDDTRRALDTVVPLGLHALAERAQAPGGAQALLDLAEQHAPQVGVVSLDDVGAGGLDRLRQSGQTLQTELFGARAGEVAGGVAAHSGVPAGGAQALLHLVLPLLLSVVGGQARAAGGTDALGGLRGQLPDLLPAGLRGLVGAGTTAGGLGSAHLSAAPEGVAPTRPAADFPEASLPAPEVAMPTASGAGGTLLELIQGQFGGEVAAQLGGLAGLGGRSAAQAVGGALPLLLDGLAEGAQTPGGAQRLLDLANQHRHLGPPAAALAQPNAAQTLQSAGETALPALLGSRQNAVVGRLATAVGAPSGGVLKLLKLLSPLLLGVIGGQVGARGLNAGGLAGLLGGLRGQLSGLLPSGLGALSGLLGGAGVAAPVAPATPAPAPVAHVEPARAGSAPERRRGNPLWWLLPLVLALGLGGCWLYNRSQVPAGTAAGTASGGALAIREPAAGASLPAGAFTLRGTGPAGAKVEVFEGGNLVGQQAQATVGQDGTWSVQVPAPETSGEHVYQARSGDATADLTVTVGAAGAGAASGSSSAATPPATAVASPDATSTGNASSPNAGAGTLSIREPAGGAQLPAGEFTLRGRGKAGDELEIFEDGTSLGRVTVGPDGTWSQAVPSPSAGEHAYQVSGPSGKADVKVSLAAAAGGAACTKAYSLSIKNGQTVKEPFRFGGVGSGRAYAVTVKRGERTIGTKALPLDATCGWSYTSKPGAGRITYQVRAQGETKVLSTINLTVGK